MSDEVKYTQADLDRAVETAVRERAKNHADAMRAKDREIAELAVKGAEYDRVQKDLDRVTLEFEAFKGQAAEDATFSSLGVSDAKTRRALKALYEVEEVEEGQQKPALEAWLTAQRATENSMVARLVGAPALSGQTDGAVGKGAAGKPATTTGPAGPAGTRIGKLTSEQFARDHRALLDKAAGLAGDARERALAEAAAYLAANASKVEG